MGALYRARVIRTPSVGVFVEIPSLNPGFEYGPCTLSVPFELAVGQSVLVGYVEDISDDVVVIGPLLTSFAEDSSVGIYPFETVAARDAAFPTPASPTFAWVEGNQQLTIYSDETPAGWREVTWAVGGVFTDQITFRNFIRVQRTPSTATSIASEAAGDTVPRFLLAVDGRMEWGPGGGARDTALYRGAARRLKTDGDLEAAGDLHLPDAAKGVKVGGSGSAASFATQRATAGDLALTARTNADGGNNRFQMDSGGTMRWGSGSAAPDTVLHRNGAGILRTDGSYQIGGDLAVDGAAFATDKLSDVSAATPVAGDLLQWNGSAWVKIAAAALMANAETVTTFGFTPAATTTSSSYANTPITSAVSIVKRYTATRLKVTMSATAFRNGGGFTGVRFGVRIGSTDYNVTQFAFNTALEHHAVPAGSIEIGGIAAGNVTVQGRWLRSTGDGTITMDEFDYISISVEEIASGRFAAIVAT